MSSSKPFHIIIVGGGPSGLSLAHALIKANISFTLLERRPEVVQNSGASIGIWPHNVRVLDQFGVLEDAKKISSTMTTGKSYQFYPDGRQMYEFPLFKWLEGKFGYELMFFERQGFVQLLFEGLPEEVRKNIRTGPTLLGLRRMKMGLGSC